MNQGRADSESKRLLLKKLEATQGLTPTHKDLLRELVESAVEPPNQLIRAGS